MDYGRGGGGFPVGVKWQTVLNEPCKEKYVICNADEGDPDIYGSFGSLKEILIVLLKPWLLQRICNWCANHGYIYISKNTQLR